jgi:hypothetical protein
MQGGSGASARDGWLQAQVLRSSPPEPCSKERLCRGTACSLTSLPPPFSVLFLAVMYAESDLRNVKMYLVTHMPHFILFGCATVESWECEWAVNKEALRRWNFLVRCITPFESRTVRHTQEKQQPTRPPRTKNSLRPLTLITEGLIH